VPGHARFIAVRLALAVTLVFVVAFAACPRVAHADVVPVPSGVAPTPTVAAPATCAWTIVGASSNCDGLDPNQLFTNTAWPTACQATNDMINRTVKSATLADGIYVKVTYAGGTDAGCRSVAASMYVPHYAGSGPCVVTLTRTSDGKTSSSGVAREAGFWSAETLALYDKSVESYASVSCTYGGHMYTGKTGSW